MIVYVWANVMFESRKHRCVSKENTSLKLCTLIEQGNFRRLDERLNDLLAQGVHVAVLSTVCTSRRQCTNMERQHV